MSIRCVRKPTFFLPAAGRREFDDGRPIGLALEGYYWSSTHISGVIGYCLRFQSGSSDPILNGGAGHGKSIRCVR